MTITDFVRGRCVDLASFSKGSRAWSVDPKYRDLIAQEAQVRFPQSCAGRTYIFRLINRWEADNWGRTECSLH